MLIQYLKFGFPVDCRPGYGSDEVQQSHKGAHEFAPQVQQALDKEVALSGFLGPFELAPFSQPKFSPLNSVEKKGSSEHRLVLDLSTPEGNSINDGIDKDTYIGKYEKLELLSIDQLVEKIVQIGITARLFKVDLLRAYKQMFIDPLNFEIMGFAFNNKMYFDCTLSMGSRSSARCCQMVTSAVVYIFANDYYFAINYLDDLGRTQEAEMAVEAYMRLKDILKKFGLKEAADKSCPPSHCMVFLGIEVMCCCLCYQSHRVS